MTDPVIVAVLTFVGVTLAALITGGITLAVQLAKWHTTNQRLWLWNRSLVDHIYRGLGPPPPSPPDDLFN